MLRVISNDEMVKQEEAEVQEAIRVRESVPKRALPGMFAASTNDIKMSALVCA